MAHEKTPLDIPCLIYPTNLYIKKPRFIMRGQGAVPPFLRLTFLRCLYDKTGGIVFIVKALIGIVDWLLVKFKVFEAINFY